MERELNRELVSERMAEMGFTQSSLAEALGLTRAAVSKWLTGKSLPRPPELLKLGKLLGLGYGQLVVTSAGTVEEPLVAFRKRAGAKTTDDHLGRAKDMGRLLRPVVPHLGFDAFIAPARLKNPSLDYKYLQDLALKLRKDLKLDPKGPIEFNDLIGKFKELQAVIVPVMWGQKQRHENALHIYLPESQTTWIYLNLDSHLHDFKFWMAHELGHLLAVDLLELGNVDFAEDFSDAFAGALLFPEAAAQAAHSLYQKARSTESRLSVIRKAAEVHVISPYSVYLEVKRYAKARAAAPFAELAEDAFFADLARFKKSYPSVSESLFDGEKPTADHFMRVCVEVFKTPIFAALGSYLKESPQSAGMIGRILDVPLADAKEFRQALG